MLNELLSHLKGQAKALFLPAEAGPDVAGDAVDLGEESARMANWLPYRSYLRNEKVFINRDSLGFVLEATPQTGADTGVIDSLKGIYTRLPSDSTLQIMMYASPNVVDHLKGYANLRMMDADAQQQAHQRGGRPARNRNVHRAMARRRFAHLLRATRHPLVEGSGFLVRNFRLVISVTLPGSVENQASLEHLLDVRDGVRSTLQASKFDNEVMTASGLIQFVGELLNPGKLRAGSAVDVGYDELMSISDQCVDRDTSGDWSDPAKVLLEKVGGTPDEKVEMRFLSVQRVPQNPFHLWNMGSLMGDLFQDSLQIPCPFVVTMGVYIPDQRAMAGTATVEKVAAERDAKGDFAKLSPTMAQKTDEWTLAIKAMANGGKLVWNYHQIMLLARPGELRRAEGAARDVWGARGFELAGDNYIHRTALLQTLPMTLSKPFCDDLQKFKRMALRTSGNTINLAPMISESRGTGTPTLLGVGRRGQLTTLDFFDNVQGGKNVCIVGDTGSGKSTLLQEIASGYASRGAVVRCFEAGRSFERLTGRLGGQFLVFGGDRVPRINPFSMVTDEVMLDTEDGPMKCGGINDDVAMLQPMLAKMASPNIPLDPPVYATLATVIKEEYEKTGRDTTVTHIWERYRLGKLYPDREFDRRLTDLADMLQPFTKHGVYANFFEGRATLDFSHSFLVFELQELTANPHLKGVVQMILLYRITQEMLQERKRQKVFILDEAKEALSGSGEDDKVQGEFVEKLYLRVRKYNGCAITATQDVAHYFASPQGASIWNQSAFILLGRQSENSVAAIRKGEAIKLDEHLQRLLNSIGDGTGHFKEWYVHSRMFRGVVRSILNPSTLMLFSNRAEDNVPIDERIARGMDVPTAIDDVLRFRGVEEAT